MTVFCLKCCAYVEADAVDAGCPRCHFDTTVTMPDRKVPTPLDKLVAAAKRYHQRRERARARAGRERWTAAMARDADRADLEQAESDLRDAADAYGKAHS